jgi:RNA methyltransferase, TrmH family
VALSRERERLLRRISTRRGREKEGLVVVEGPRVLATALAAGAVPSFVVTARGASWDPRGELGPRLDEGGVEVLELPGERLDALAHTETSQGLLAVVPEPRPSLPDPSGRGVERCLVLDRVQDPGNAGTLVRAAAAFGVDRVLVLDGTVDPWNAKAVRASAGLSFHLPLHLLRWDRARQWLEAAQLPLLVAEASGADVRAWRRKDEPPAGWALLVGNEAAGPRGEALAHAAASLAIPLAPAVDSLNVAMAGTVLLWALGPGGDSPRLPEPEP